jgi:hypothetical protein
MKLKDIRESYGCRFEFKGDNPLIPYMILNGRWLKLGFISFVDLNNGNIASFSKGNVILEHPVRINRYK